jgi:serine/threonine-protein kinase HipA
MSPVRPTATPRQQVEVVLDADVLDAACRVGVLFHTAAHGREVFSFRYDPAWLRHPDAFAIDPDLSLHGGETYPSSANGAFRIFLDSAPDRWGRVLLERREILRARDEARRPRTLNEWDYLLGVHDMCRLGALRFRLEENSTFLDDDARLSAPPLATLRELEAASLALEAPESEESPRFREWLNALLAPGSSLGGARPKANFTDTDQTLWIAKFPSRNDRRDIGAWEMVVHELAVRAGLHVPSARLLELGGAYRTFACQRFDRRGTRRRFFVSAMTMLGRADGEGGSYLDLAEFLSTRGSVRHRDEDLRQLWTRVVFNILTSNTDDHLRNHGYILEGDGWRLAPAYDMNANPDGGPHALAINERDQTADIALALATAGYYGLKPPEAQSILTQVRSVVAQWSTVAASLNFPRSEIARMTSAFTVE